MGELRKSGAKLKLQGQPLQVLEMLVERPGDLVTREEIQSRLWPDTFVDVEGSLNSAVLRLREALGDSAESPRFIETLPRRGYRFVGQVEAIGESAEPVPRAQAERKMLAVLPFENLTGDPAQEFFSDGQTDELISQLGRLNPSRLGVIGRTSVMPYKRTSKTVGQIAKDLGVAYLLEGSVRRSGDKVRIVAKLIESDQTLRWTESYDRPVSDILIVQNEVAAAIASAIHIELAPAKKPRAVHPASYEACLSGRYYWNLRTEEGFRRGIALLQSAVQMDPEHALAHAWLADAYSVLGYYSVLPPAEVYPQAKAAAKRALELDDRLAEAHASLADVLSIYDWDFAAAEQEYRRALELNPSYASGHQWFANYLMSRGRFDEAQAEIDKARAIDPLSSLIGGAAGLVLYTARRFDQAIEQCRRTIERDPAFPLAHNWLGMAILQKKQFDEAIAEFQKGIDLSGQNPNAIALKGYAYALAGRRQEALEVIGTLEKVAAQRYVSPACFALVYVGLDDRTNVFLWAERAVQDRAGWMARLKVDPLLDAVRPDPRFQDLMKRIGL